MLGSSAFWAKELFLFPPGHYLLAWLLLPSLLEAERHRRGNGHRISKRHGGITRPSWIRHKEASRRRLAHCPPRSNHPGCTQTHARILQRLFPGRPQSTSRDAHLATLGSQNEILNQEAWLSLHKASQRSNERQARWYTVPGWVALFFQLSFALNCCLGLRFGGCPRRHPPPVCLTSTPLLCAFRLLSPEMLRALPAWGSWEPGTCRALPGAPARRAGAGKGALSFAFLGL